VWVAPNKPYGAIISYYLSGPAPSANITILAAAGAPIQRLSGTASPGINRVVWNLREPGCSVAPEATGGRRGGRGGPGQGPRAMPGDYRVRLEANGETVEEKLTVRLDPRVQATPADLEAYSREVKRLYGMQCSIDASLAKITTLRSQVTATSAKLEASELKALAEDLKQQLSTIEADLEPPPNDPEHLNLRRRLTWLVDQVQNYSGRPTNAQVEWIGIFEGQLKPLLLRLNELVENRLPKFNDRLKAAGLPPVGQ
jgi:hypothetical protein